MKKIIIILFAIATFISCNEEPDSIGQTAVDSTAPGEITNIQVENGPGSAKITYDLPDDEDLLYVKATYKVNETVTRNAEASYYNNELSLEGFGESKPYNVTLVAVDRSKNESTPVMVVVNPEIAPVQLAFESMALIPAFGGVNLQWSNQAENDLNVAVFVNDTINEGDFLEQTIIYSSATEGDENIRGFEPEPRTFRVVITDRWGNNSDTLEVADLKPLKEIEFDPEEWVVTSNIGNHSAGPVRMMTDGITSGSGNRALWRNYSMVDRPHITIDLGRKCKLSRMLYWQWDLRFYDHSNTRYFNVWGSNNLSDDLNDYSSWELIIENGEVVKPSGLPRGQTTAEDRQQAREGHVTDYPISTPAYRYLRYEIISSWDMSKTFIQITELKLFGAYADAE